MVSYRDRAVRIDNSAALDSEGTLNLTWSPDKGDLRIHRLEILRDGETIDLVASGVEFEVLRREQGLEQRLLDGRLTATVAIPGLQEGDVLRLAHSTTLADQALGDEMQEAQYLPALPFRVGRGRAIISWPRDSDVMWQAGPDLDLAEPTERDGYRWLTAEFPLPKRAETPRDAPSRFRRAQMVQVGTFADWSEMSRVMSPHYQKAALLDSGGEIAGQVAKIVQATDDPLDRMVRATRLVQEEVSYLLNGLDGGNYLPQDASDTWEKRYGDCQAKSVLLVAMLRQMGIDADPVLVATNGGDAAPGLLPILAVANDPVNGVDPTGMACVGQDSDYCDRSDAYREIQNDPQIDSKTDFFNGVAAMTDNLGNLDLPFGESIARIDEDTASALNDLSGEIFGFNKAQAELVRSGEISGTRSEVNAQLVAREQGFIQGKLSQMPTEQRANVVNAVTAAQMAPLRSRLCTPLTRWSHSLQARLEPNSKGQLTSATYDTEFSSELISRLW